MLPRKRLEGTVLYYIILYYTTLYYILFYSILFYYIILYYIILYYITLYYIILYRFPRRVLGSGVTEPPKFRFSRSSSGRRTGNFQFRMFRVLPCSRKLGLWGVWVFFGASLWSCQGLAVVLGCFRRSHKHPEGPKALNSSLP